MTVSAWAVVSTMQIVRSAPAATRSGESATVAPRARSGSTFAGSMSCTISGKPCLTRFRAIGRPMLPRPMKPTDPAITPSLAPRSRTLPRREDPNLEPLRDPGGEHPRRARDPFQELGAAGPVLEHHAAVHEGQDSVDDDRGDDQVVQVAEHRNEVRDQVHRRDELEDGGRQDRKSTRLNSSHRTISYAVFCLKKKKTKKRSLGASPRCTVRRRARPPAPPSISQARYPAPRCPRAWISSRRGSVPPCARVRLPS